MTTSVMSKPLKKALEIERKFPCLSPLFSVNAGSPPFAALRRLPDQRFTDTYLDSHGRLMTEGIYIRRRNGDYEAKISLDGTFTKSKFLEIKGKDDVELYLKKHGIRIGDLAGIARFSTHRKAWIADEEFLVVMDKTCFGHQVGEVEYIGDSEVSTSNEVGSSSSTTPEQMLNATSAFSLAVLLDDALTKIVGFFLHPFVSDIGSTSPTTPSKHLPSNPAAASPTTNQENMTSNDTSEELTSQLNTSSNIYPTDISTSLLTELSSHIVDHPPTIASNNTSPSTPPSEATTHPDHSSTIPLTTLEKHHLALAAHKIDAFMSRYSWAFSPGSSPTKPTSNDLDSSVTNRATTIDGECAGRTTSYSRGGSIVVKHMAAEEAKRVQTEEVVGKLTAYFERYGYPEGWGKGSSLAAASPSVPLGGEAGHGKTGQSAKGKGVGRYAGGNEVVGTGWCGVMDYGL
ncbi:hypothetical protein KVT40_002263 [Elsinoe batatas]|uniref:CYTH domain-containing protein n=1 Tax=Elsinoe batatas TaxID=2601811 RepID=A0A8K0PM44_9PEZI|nr:hypothetical protein KVT40_002263 [Elsinoe batatas]